MLLATEIAQYKEDQKILEESPAPFLGDATRKLLHESAVSLAKKLAISMLEQLSFSLSGLTMSKAKTCNQYSF